MAAVQPGRKLRPEERDPAAAGSFTGRIGLRKPSQATRSRGCAADPHPEPLPPCRSVPPPRTAAITAPGAVPRYRHWPRRADAGGGTRSPARPRPAGPTSILGAGAVRGARSGGGEARPDPRRPRLRCVLSTRTAAAPGRPLPGLLASRALRPAAPLPPERAGRPRGGTAPCPRGARPR